MSILISKLPCEVVWEGLILSLEIRKKYRLAKVTQLEFKTRSLNSKA